jgi:Ca2+-transporting ATPase
MQQGVFYYLIAFGVVKEPMFLLLIGAGVVYLIIGSFREALTLLFFVFVIKFDFSIIERELIFPL